MDQKHILKQMLEFNKSGFDSTFASAEKLQEQFEKISSDMIEQATWLPKEGKAAIGEWTKACKEGRAGFKKTMDDNYEKVMAFFDTPAK